MLVAWTKHLKDIQEKEEFQSQIIGAKPVLDRLKQILTEEEAQIDRSEMDIKIFDQPNWAERQAYKNGCRAMLSILKRLVDLDQQRN